MDKELLLLITCLAISLGGYGACFYFAKKDWFGYAIGAFLIASSTLTAAGKIVYDTRSAPVQTTAR